MRPESINRWKSDWKSSCCCARFPSYLRSAITFTSFYYCCKISICSSHGFFSFSNANKFEFLTLDVWFFFEKVNSALYIPSTYNKHVLLSVFIIMTLNSLFIYLSDFSILKFFKSKIYLSVNNVKFWNFENFCTCCNCEQL